MRNMVEDDIDRLIRKLHEKREVYAEQVLQGGASVENVAEGYYAIVAKIAAYDEAIALIRDELAGWTPVGIVGEETRKPAKVRPLDY